MSIRGVWGVEDFPIKQLRSSLLPQALPLTDRRERHKTTQKINVPFARDTAFRVGVRLAKGTATTRGQTGGMLA